VTEKKKKGRPVPPKNRKRQNVQITLAPEEIDILNELRDRYGDGTRSLLVGMAIRHAKRTGFFDDDRMFQRHAEAAAPGPMTLEGAVAQHLPKLLERLGREALKPQGG